MYIYIQMSIKPLIKSKKRINQIKKSRRVVDCYCFYFVLFFYLPKNCYSQFHSDAKKGPKLDIWQDLTWEGLQKTPVKYNPL